MKNEFEYYLGFADKIEGWFEPEAAEVIFLFDRIQKEEEIGGDIFEIGVHHGKMSLCLGLLLADEEKLSVCDIFARQEYNISESGYGSKSIFLGNWRKYMDGAAEPEIFEKPSEELGISEIGSNYRIFSIDGGHSAAETYADLSLADNVIIDHGIIIIDDYFDQSFPGVSEGVNKYLLNYASLQPLAIFFNKMMLVKKGSYDFYREALYGYSFYNILNSRGYMISERDFYGVPAMTIRRYSPAQLFLKRSAAGVKKVFGDSLRGSRLHMYYKKLIKPGK
jgi:hypothetical protein